MPSYRVALAAPGYPAYRNILAALNLEAVDLPTSAADRFGEAPLFPAIRLAENFVPRADIERVYLRNSRTPEQNALNMRARVAAGNQ